jgi:hypothetical protein
MSNRCHQLLSGAVMLAALVCHDVFAQATYPKDVTDFLQSRGDCEDLRGNMSFTVPGRESDLRDALKDIKDQCRGTDRALDALKRKYADDPAVMQKLNGYDSRIERDSR